MDCHHCITNPQNARRDSIFAWKTEEPSKSSKQGLGPRAIARQIGCAQSTPLRMSFGEAHRPARATRKAQVTPPRWEKPSIGPTECPATGIRKRASATLPAGWFGKSGNTSGPWMPAVAMPSDTACSSRRRWSVPVPSTTWSGKGTSPSSRETARALKRKAKKHRVRENKKRYGTSISGRPEIASLRLEEGHWEGDTVVGKRAGKEAVVFSLLEKERKPTLRSVSLVKPVRR